MKGASQWIGGEDGKRLITLTEKADFSTLIHEFIGHATEETARRYPEYWMPVEQLIGKVLKDWTTADHEKFAKWVERYLSSSAGSITLGPMFKKPPKDPPAQPEVEPPSSRSD